MPHPDFPTLFDLFCGAGGLSLGLIQAGFNVLGAIDSSPSAVETYRENVGDHVRLEEITESTDVPNCDVIAGGPPCQGFSSAGLRNVDDRRNTLVSVFTSLICKVRPKAFLFENVEGFLTSGNGRQVLELLEPLVDAGYRIHLRKVNAANFGVPQHRKRVIAIGGLGWNPLFVQATHSAIGAPGATLDGYNLPLGPTLVEAIGSLPPAANNGSPPAASDHSYRPLSAGDLERAKLLRQGQTMRDLPEEYWHESYKRRANRRVMDGTPTERRGGAPAGLRRLVADEPSKAITSGAKSEFLHPFEDRNLTLRECARIQTFPDSFSFHGTLQERSLLIGNAVPPLLGRTIGNALLQSVLSHDQCEHFDTGCLLSFVPTLSIGMSPALKHTCDKVAERFDPTPHERQLALWH